MASRKDLKKDIKMICGDLAEATQFVAYFREGVDVNKLNELINQIAELQTTSLKRANVSFDKVPKDFANKAEYNKARNAYMRASIKSLLTALYEQRDLIIKELNACAKA